MNSSHITESLEAAVNSKRSGRLSRSAICVVTAGGPHPWIIINALRLKFGAITVIIEDPESRWTFLRRRARLTGWFSTTGQFATMLLVRAGKLVYSRRIKRLVAEHGIEVRQSADQSVVRVSSVNSAPFVEAIELLNPEVVLLAGCRIIKPGVLDRIGCPVLNYHAGITPQYRGMNGGYWSLACGDRRNFGATVHRVDAGVDTGAVIAQMRCDPAPDDNIMTYPYRLAAKSREICIAAVVDALSGNLTPHFPDGRSRQWFHPTIWSYAWTGLTKGVW